MFIDKALQNALYKIGVEVANEAKKVAPVQTSNLKNDIQVFSAKLPIGIVEVGNTQTAPYAKFVHFGTKPYVIVPKRKKALKTPYGVYKRVKHPGIKANPYLYNGLEDALRGDSIEKTIEQNGLDEAIFKDLNLDKLDTIK